MPCLARGMESVATNKCGCSGARCDQAPLQALQHCVPAVLLATSFQCPASDTHRIALEDAEVELRRARGRRGRHALRPGPEADHFQSPELNSMLGPLAGCAGRAIRLRVRLHLEALHLRQGSQGLLPSRALCTGADQGAVRHHRWFQSLFLQQLQHEKGLLPLWALLRSFGCARADGVRTHGCSVCDHVRLQRSPLYIVEERDDLLPLTSLLACSNGSIIGHEIRLQACAVGLLEQLRG
mmetsp:Transcript_47912/g.104213  ORF Transcript_47912/g.104213 Transcript_47912/m.104213 type:complete len:239 (+) Transcript_47912:389-1105(+)